MAFDGFEIIHVVAIDQKQCIGKGNALPWHISADLKHFKEITQGGIIIMGRKTLESMGRALPHRVNWVITRDPNWHFDGVKVAHSLRDALDGAAQDATQLGQTSLFIIGGGEIFKQSLDIADRLELTHIELDVQGDAHYPHIPDDFQKIKSETHQDEKTHIAYEFATYKRHK